jgi:glycosyltransferase involved in cell wall biosynthesis
MKLGFLFGPISAGTTSPQGPRPFDFTRIEQDPRGLTGTDGSFLSYAKFMAARGHDVTLFCAENPQTTTWGKVKVRPFPERASIDDTWDAALTWNEPAALDVVSPKVVRICDMQFNDFTYVKGPEYAWVDAFGPASTSLGNRLKHMGPPAHIPWYTMYNGCDPTVYDAAPKVPGRCIYTSSPDRGLHLVLDQWPRIREAVPYAELRVFYHSMAHWFQSIPGLISAPQENLREHGRRAMFVRDRLSLPGVIHIGSISRDQLALEYSEAKVLAYPCDPFQYTEGYGVAIIEGCASGAVPVISRADALPEIYEGACPMVDAPASHHGHEWADMVIKILKDEQEHKKWWDLGRERAKKYDYRVLCIELERIINELKAKKASL